MSENCPDACAGKQKLQSLRTQLSMNKVVEKVIGSELESVTYAAGHPLQNALSYVHVYSDDGEIRRLTPVEQTRVADAYARRETAVRKQESRVENCPGECEASIEQGPLAGRVLRLCGLTAMNAVQD